MPSPTPDGGAPPSRPGVAARLGGMVLACAFAGAGPFAGADEARDHPGLGRAVETLALKLIGEAGLLEKDEWNREKKVLVSPRNFVFAGGETGCDLPLSKRLADMFASRFREYGVPVVSGSADENSAITLWGEWAVGAGSEYLDLSLKVTRMAVENEPSQLASKVGRVPVTSIGEKDRTPDLGHHFCNVVRRIEGKTRGDRPRTVYVRPLSVSGRMAAQPERLGRYLSDRIAQALGESTRFDPVEVAATLEEVPVHDQLSRALRPPGAGSVPETGTNGPSLIGDALQADADLYGEVVDDGERIEIVVNVRDRRNGAVIGTAETLSKRLFPGSLFREPNESVRRCRDWAPPEGPDGGLELATNRGEGLVTFRDGDEVRFMVRAHRRSWLYLFNIDPECEVTLLYVSSAALDAGRPVAIPPPDRGPFEVAPPYGREIVFAVATAERADPPRQPSARGAGLHALNAWWRGLKRGGGGLAQAQVTVSTAP